MIRSELFADPLVFGRAKARGEPRMTLPLGSAREGIAGLLAKRALEGAIPLPLDLSSGDGTVVSVPGGEECLSRGTSSTRNWVARLSSAGRMMLPATLRR